jgi:hypothetical protein
MAEGNRVYGIESGYEQADYHMGRGNMLKALSLYTGETVNSSNAAEVIRRRKLTYPLVFFNNSPRYKPALYAFFGKLKDHSPTYYFGTQAAYELLKVYQKNPTDYAKIWEQYRPKFPGRDESPNRMWSYWGEADVKRLSIQNLDLLKAEWKSGRIVPMPNQPERFRTTGESPIGEAVLNPRDKKWYNPANQKWYMGSEPATLGCLLYVAYELRKIQGSAFRSLETNSLARDLEYQKRIAKGNSVAITALPTHVMAKGFDLPRKLMPASQQGDLVFLLKDLESLGLLSWIQEGAAGQMAYHVVPDPSYETFFADIYKDAQAYLSR